jgi:hypothetical protein
MTEARNNIIIDKDTHIKFGLRCYEKKLITAPNRIAPTVEAIMALYVLGTLKVALTYEDKAVGNPMKGEKYHKHVLVNKKLKNEFSVKAWKEGFIPEPIRASWFIHRLMKRYINGDFDKFFTKTRRK